MPLAHVDPEVQVFLGVAPKELAFSVLQAVVANSQNGMFRFDALKSHERTGIAATTIWGYGQQHEHDAEVAVTEAWRWLEFNMFILPAPDTNGRNGWFVLGRRGRARMNRDQFADYTRESRFSRELIHPTIIDQVWIVLARGEFANAVFLSFRAVEEAVRIGGGYAATDIGTDLMRKAFDPRGGPLTKASDPQPEREALAHLFAGAIGSYKTPHSHRTVTINDASEAQEMAMASLTLPAHCRFAKKKIVVQSL